MPITIKSKATPHRLAALLVASGLVLAACGGGDASPSVAALDPTTTTGEDSAGSGRDAEPDAVAYAQCMRDNGVPGFPDPNGDGRFEIDANQLGVPPDSPQFAAADEACDPLFPRRSDAQQAEDYQAFLEYAQCMRSEGITDFPDPPLPSDGPTTDTNSGQQQGGIDPESPQFQAAHEACQQHLPAGDQGPTLSDRDRP